MLTGRVTEVQITSNARIKHYPCMDVLQVSNAPIFRKEGYESVMPRQYDVPSKGHAADPERSLRASRTRAAAAVRDITLCNPFTHFITLTLSPKMIDRYNADNVSKKLQIFLKNCSSRKGLKYIVVPEKHKDGAIHLHGLCMLGDMKIERAYNPNTGKVLSTYQGQPIYNMPEWIYGYSMCVPVVGAYEKVCSYIAKYLTKDKNKIFGKWYFTSRDLQKKPCKEIIESIDYWKLRTNYPELREYKLYKDVCLCSIRTDSLIRGEYVC